MSERRLCGLLVAGPPGVPEADRAFLSRTFARLKATQAKLCELDLF